jgi:hypothetical protein
MAPMESIIVKVVIKINSFFTGNSSVAIEIELKINQLQLFTDKNTPKSLARELSISPRELMELLKKVIDNNKMRGWKSNV